MNNYRPTYGNSPGSYDPLPPPPPGVAPPPLLPPPPPPSAPLPDFDPYRDGDSWRPEPPRSEYSFRNNSSAPSFPREHEYLRPTRSREYALKENGQSQRGRNNRDNVNLNYQQRRAQNRQNYRTVPADRPLLRLHDQNEAQEQMLGMTNGQRFMASEDMSDSDEEQMDESESETEKVELVDENMNTMKISGDVNQENSDMLERPSKRRALTATTSDAQNGSSQPRWSNPDPYTVLPPVDDASRKRKDVVKLIRKARMEADGVASERSQAAANDDFISFGMENDENTEDEVGQGVPGAPSGPRSFSHKNNLHHAEYPEPSNENASISSHHPPSEPVISQAEVAKEVVLDLSSPGSQRNGASYLDDTNDSLGNRKRTHDDSIKGGKKSSTNGSILPDWRPAPGVDPVPWLRQSKTITANAGFRLHKEICDFYDFVKPRDFEQTIRQELLSRLQNTISAEVSQSTVHCFGSFAAGLYLPNADMDIVIMSDTFVSSGQKIICQTGTQMYRLATYLEQSGLAKNKCEVITRARVPLIKFVDRYTDIKVDLSFENDTGVKANSTFTSWKRQYPAMPVLVTVIKQFLMMRGLNEVQHGGLGGFSVTCLVTSLLQNMPRIQSGEVVPEQHLGEMLLEFLDFYGNRLDTGRTGITMFPPGYFEKNVYRRPNSNKRTAIYQGNKANRLAIIDPNKPENDISGGSRQVLLIFERFAKAYREISQAIKTPSRISLLDWLLGGDYGAFTSQRNHLSRLYRERAASPVIVHAKRDSPGKSFVESGDELQGATRSGNVQQKHVSTETSHSTFQTAAVKVSNESVPNTSPVQELSGRNKPPLPAPGTNARRAIELKAQYPGIKGIGARVTRKRKAQLIADHEAQLRQSTNPFPKQPNKITKGNTRACKLRKKYPDMGPIPEQIGPKMRQKLITEYNERKGVSRRSVVRKSNAPSKRADPGPSLSTRPISNRMAPLSDERRAEVARNLSGTSTDDPIDID